MPEERSRFFHSQSPPAQIDDDHFEKLKLLSTTISPNSTETPRTLSTFESFQPLNHNHPSSIPIFHSQSSRQARNSSISEFDSSKDLSSPPNQRARSAEPGLDFKSDRFINQTIQTSSSGIKSPKNLKPDTHSSPLKKILADEAHPTPTIHPPPRPTTCDSIYKKSDHSTPSRATSGRTNSLTRISHHSSSLSNSLPPILSTSEHLQSESLLRSQTSDSSISPPRNPVTLCPSNSPSPVSFTSHSVPLDHSSPTPSAPTQVSSNPLSRIRTALTPPPFQSPARTPLTCTSQSNVSKLLHSSNSFAFATERGQSKPATNTSTSPKIDARHSPNPHPSSLLRSPLSSARPSPTKSVPSSAQALNTDRPTFSPLAISPHPSSSHSDSNPGGVNDKPTYSYAALIGQAIMCSESKKVCLNDIYAYIMHNYSYYRKDEAGWQNSIRHNLSLNESFIKVPRGPNEPGKGSFWAIAPGAEDQFVNGGFKKKSSSISAPSHQSNRDQSSRHAKVAGSSGSKKVKSNGEEPMKAGPSTLTPTINITPISTNPISSARTPGMRTVSHANYSRSQPSLSSSPQYSSSPHRSGYHHSPTEDLMTATMSRVRASGIRHSSSSASSTPWTGSKESGIQKRSQAQMTETPKWGSKEIRNREPSVLHRHSLTIHHPHHQPTQPTPSTQSNLSRYPVSLSLSHKKRRVGEGESASSPSYRIITSIRDSPLFSKPILDETDQTFGTPRTRTSSTSKYSLPALPKVNRSTNIPSSTRRDEEESLRLAPIIGGSIDDEELEKKKLMRHRSSPIRLSSVNEILNSTHPFKVVNGMSRSPKLLHPPLSSFRSTVLNHHPHHHHHHHNSSSHSHRHQGDEGNGGGGGGEMNEDTEESKEMEEDEMEIDEMEDE